MKRLVFIVILNLVNKFQHINGEIGKESPMLNKLTRIKPVGGISKFLPLTEIPPPTAPASGRRHLEDCRVIPYEKKVVEAGNVNIVGDYYDDRIEKKVVTVRIPIHIDHKHFEVTTQVPYFTVGPIGGIGFHPKPKKRPSSCERIYQDHLAEQYDGGDSMDDLSEESLEMARYRVAGEISPSAEFQREKFYSDLIS